MVIVITGCSSGIGLATALHLKEHGFNVCPTARNQHDVDMLKNIGFKDALQLDVTNNKQIASAIQYIVDKHKVIDVWFNNAGYGQPSMIEDLPTEVLKEQFETNVFGLHECTRQILKVMRKQGYGKIIQHSSVLGIISLAGRGAYNASKYAVEGLSDTLRVELKDTDISVVTLNTGPITSNFRINAIKKLKENIDIDSSIHKEAYKANINGTGKRVPFNEDALYVARIVHKIIVSKRPKPRYYITKATYLLGGLKRVLSTNALDYILRKI